MKNYKITTPNKVLYRSGHNIVDAIAKTIILNDINVDDIIEIKEVTNNIRNN